MTTSPARPPLRSRGGAGGPPRRISPGKVAAHPKFDALPGGDHPDWLRGNFCRLAEMFGVDVQLEELTDDEKYDLNTYRAYEQAATIVAGCQEGDLYDARMEKLGWKDSVRQELGIGTVRSHRWFIEQLTEVYKWNLKFLRQVGLDDKILFGQNRLIFTVCDEFGRPVGFASRALEYDKLRQEFDEAAQQALGFTAAELGTPDGKEKVAEWVKTPEGAAAQAKLNKGPKKYVNTAISGTRHHGDAETTIQNRIYRKDHRLFGFHVARKHVPPLYIFEGYPDAVTAHQYGLKNSCAIGGIEFSSHHLELLLSNTPAPIKHVVFVLDADPAGVCGTEKFVRLISEYFGDRPGMKVEVELVLMPEGTDDPDAYIRASKGIEPFQQLPRLDLFRIR